MKFQGVKPCFIGYNIIGLAYGNLKVWNKLIDLSRDRVSSIQLFPSTLYKCFTHPTGNFKITLTMDESSLKLI